MEAKRTTLLPILATALFLLLMSFSPAAAQTNSTSTVTASTGTNIPAPTGCTAPGYLASPSLISSLGSSTTTRKSGLKFGNPPTSDRTYEYLFLGAGGLLAILVVVGIIWAIAAGISRAVRRNRKEVSAQKARHTARNVYLVFLVIALVAFAPAAYVLAPYLHPTKGTTQTNGVVENIVSPENQIQILAPYSIKYYYVPAYVNNESTLLEGNFTALSGANVQVVVIPDDQRSDWFGNLSAGNYAGVTGCTMDGMPVYYDSGPVTSGAFAVEIPPVTNQTNYDVIFADSSASQNVTVIANVYWGY